VTTSTTAATPRKASTRCADRVAERRHPSRSADCSNVAEPVFGILQKKVGDASDSGYSSPLHRRRAKAAWLDLAMGLPQRTERSAMYKSLFEWIKATRPDVKTIWAASRRTSRTATRPTT